MKENFRRIVSFARKRTRNKEKVQQILSTQLTNFAVDKENPLNIKGCTSYALEIGFGSGENILDRAKENLSIGYFGCEVFTGGVAKLTENMVNSQVNNIRIWHNDALELIPALPDHCLSYIYILYPDPWPKTRHNKRRLINVELLKLLATKMTKDATLLMVTDHQSYADSISDSIAQVKDIYEVLDEKPEISKTKYRLKAEAKGIHSHYFCLKLKMLS